VSLLAALLAIALGVLVGTGHVTLHWIWLLATLLGIVQSFERPAGQALLYELVGPEQVASAVGLNGTLNATTRLLGPAAAGAVIATLGMAACFFANAVSFLAVLIAVSRSRRDVPRGRPHGAHPRQVHLC
jgi:MFS family permease